MWSKHVIKRSFTMFTSIRAVVIDPLCKINIELLNGDLTSANISSAIIKRVLQHGNFFSGQCGFVTLVCLMTEDFTDHFLTSGNI